MRILAVTGNASLVVALGSMKRDWEVATARDVDAATAAAPGASVALIDFGSTERGLEAAETLYRAGVMLPCVVIGDAPAADARAGILVRPFSLDDLSEAVHAAADARGGGRAGTAAHSPAAPDGASVGERRLEEAEPQPRRLSMVPAREPSRAPVEDESHPMPEPDASEPSGDRAEVHATTSPEVESFEEAPTRRPSAPPAPEPPAERERESRWAAAIPARPTETPAPGRRRGRRRGLREAPEDLPQEPPIVRRLREAAAAAAEIDALLDEMPFLADPHAMAEAFLGEVADEFAPQTGAVLLPRDDGFHVVACLGLSPVEMSMVVAATQPLFREILATGEGILVQPVDLAQGLVGGIGGARTEALMAAPAYVERICVAMVVVGGPSFDDKHLDVLSGLAAEAAPGLAVADLLGRLRRRS